MHHSLKIHFESLRATLSGLGLELKPPSVRVSKTRSRGDHSFRRQYGGDKRGSMMPADHLRLLELHRSHVVILQHGW